MVVGKQWVRPRWHLLYTLENVIAQCDCGTWKIFSAPPPLPCFSDSESVWKAVKKWSVSRWINISPVYRLFPYRFWCVLEMNHFQKVLQTHVPNVLCLGAHFWCQVIGVIICLILFVSLLIDDLKTGAYGVLRWTTPGWNRQHGYLTPFHWTWRFLVCYSVRDSSLHFLGIFCSQRVISEK